MLSVGAARRRIVRLVHRLETQQVPIDASLGRVLAAAIRASALPPFDNSSVDGFAVIAGDVRGARPGAPVHLDVIADIPAGASPSRRLRRGQAARIMTGARLPRGATAVVMLEDTDAWPKQSTRRLPRQVGTYRAVRVGENVRKRGSDARSGETVLQSQQIVRPQDLGLLAMLNRNVLPVIRRPRIALLSSGDELVPVGEPTKAGQIHDTNTHTLGALLQTSGCQVISLGIARDVRSSVLSRLERGVRRGADLILSSAGVSVGAFDLVREVVSSEGSLDFWKVNVRPGKPLAVGRFRGVPFIGLPGNPVSAFVGFHLFVLPAVHRMLGLPMHSHGETVAELMQPIRSDGRESYLRATLSEKSGRYTARLAGSQGSGNLRSLVECNALLIIPAGVKSLPVGARARVWLL
jgi:molybdopterin molybdotransferase